MQSEQRVRLLQTLAPGTSPRGPWPRLPGSKSITQRYFNLALLGGLRLTVHHPLVSEDTVHYLEALETCGCSVQRQDETVHIDATGRGGTGEIFCGAGGTMMRFLTAALTAVPGTWRLDGIERLRQRPAAPLIDTLRQLGAAIRSLGAADLPPLEIAGGSLQGGRASLDAGASSQFLSAVLMAGLAAPRGLEVELRALISEPYVDLTLDAIAELGGVVEGPDDGVYRVRPGGLRDSEVTVEADFSAAAYPAAAAALSGGEVVLRGLRAESRQGDRRFLDLLRQMGASVTWNDGSLRVVGGPLRAIDADMADIPDQVPTLAALAPFAEGTTVIRNVPHLRHKESDRLSAMHRELRAVGVPVEEMDDGLRIEGIWHRSSPPTEPVTVASHGDHRIAMSMALVGLRRPALTIAAPEVVAKSYPEFWRHLEAWIQT